MKRLIFMVLVSVFGILMISGCAYGIRYDGPYSGRIIDADTGKPIEKAVVLGVWYREIITPGGATHNFYDAKETVTDKNGDFTIAGQGLLVLTNVEPMDIVIFKAGYEHMAGSWISLKKDIILSKKINWEGSKAIIPLKKWILEERRNRFGSYYVNIPNEKQKLLLKEIAMENKEIGK
jgi:hypothetical protein